MHKTVKTVLHVAAAAVMALAFGKAYAFHDGGVGECGGCHSMHSPKDQPNGTSYLLAGTDQGSTCLNCHQNALDTGPSNYHVSTDPSKLTGTGSPLQRSPGGDFAWLKKTYTWGTNTEPGASHGHNIVAIDFTYSADGTVAPGGTMDATQLTCASCHDMHGQARRLSTGAIALTGAPIVGSGSYNTSKGNSTTNPIPSGQAVGIYRLLWNRTAPADVGGAAFTGVPAAVAPATYNRTEGVSQTRVAYGIATTGGHITWGNWCGTCHPGMHSSGNYVHPIDQALGSTILNNYNTYVSSGIMTGSSSSAFTSLVPFMKNTGDYTVLGPLAASGASTTNGTLAGPADSDAVACLSCHRAHASAFPDMIRWQNEYELITIADTLNAPRYYGTELDGATARGARGRTTAEYQASYYDRPASAFGIYQRVLCNKCHAKD